MSDNRTALLSGDLSQRLDTGMTVGEAISLTKSWWERIGRRQMVEMREHQNKDKKGFFASQNPDDSNFLPSGVLHGLEWGMLTKREKLTLIKHYHHFHVRMHDVIGTPEHEYKFGQRSTIN